MAVFPSDSVRTKNWGTEILTDSDLESQLDLLHAYFTACLNSSTGHTHDGTANQGPRLAYGGVTATFGNGFTTVTAASGDYVLLAADVSDSNNTKKALVSDIITAATFTPSTSNALSGSVLQVQQSQDATQDTSTTAMPFDNTTPQNTEGEEYTQLAVTITPSNASNILFIELDCYLVHSSGLTMCGAVFQDTTANAIASGWTVSSAGFLESRMRINKKMTAGTTSATTFKFRYGPSSASGTAKTNSDTSGNAVFNGTLFSSLKVTEVKA